MQYRVEGFSDQQSLVSFGRGIDPKLGEYLKHLAEVGFLLVGAPILTGIGVGAGKAAETISQDLIMQAYNASKEKGNNEDAFKKEIQNRAK